MKKILLLTIGLFIFFFTSSAANAATWTVTKSTNSNDGACNADCSLREAVAAADSGDTVVFNSNLVGQTFTLGGSLITITKRITIDGNLDGTNVVFLSGSGTSSHFLIPGGGGLTLKNMILVQGGGNAVGSIDVFGGGILSLDRVAIRGNYGFYTGAISLTGNANHIITNSSITGNTAGAVPAMVVGESSRVYMSNTTISGNRVVGNEPDERGTITNYGKIVLRNCTVAANEAKLGGGIYSGGGVAGDLDIGNSIIAENTATVSGQDIEVTSDQLLSVGGNLIGDSDTIPDGIFDETSDVINVNPLLAPTNSLPGGHPVLSHPLQAGSPARNGGINANAVEPLSNTPLTFDTRGSGFPRIIDTTVDKGAFEDESGNTSLIVTKKPDTNDLVCDLDCSLREAVHQASLVFGTNTITFHPSVFGTITLGSEIVISNNDVNIVGNQKADVLTISGGNANRIFHINSNSDVSMSGLTLADGNSVGESLNGRGAAILSVGNSNLTLDRVIVRSNVSEYAALELQSGSHRIINSTINNNSADQCSAIHAILSATLAIANTTISTNTNSSPTNGNGTLCSDGAGTTIRNSTIAFNRTTNGNGGGIRSITAVNLGNTIVANNLAPIGADIYQAGFGSLSSAGGNLVRDTNGFPAGTFNQTNDATGVDPMLAALGDNGGNVPTHLLQANSPAINSGLNSNAVDPFDDSVLPTDARGSGFTRIVLVVDKGAFETLIPTSATVSVSGRVTVDGRGLAKAQVYYTDFHGQTHVVITSSLGYYRFDEVEVGETYVFQVSSKRYAFAPQLVTVTDEVNDLNFVSK